MLIEDDPNCNILTLYKLVDNQVEASEFLVTESSKVINIPLKDLELKKDILIGGVFLLNCMLSIISYI